MADRTPSRQILAPDQIDRVAEAVLAVTRELWVTRDRLMMLESVLLRHGIDAAAEIDTIDPDPALREKLDGARDRLIRSVADALNGQA